MAPPTWVVGQVLTASDVNTWFVPLVAYKSADQSLTSNTTLQNDNALSVTVAANATYWFELYLNFEGGTTGSSDIKVGWTFPSGLTMRYQDIYADTGAVARLAVTDIQTSVIAVGSNGAGNLRAYSARGTVLTSGTSGTLQLQWAQNTSSGTATIVHAGSVLMLQRIS